ncbi:TrbG/VirB9 family P-type conjugative transfer protein [Pseudomonas aeruginosa]|uniref:TrbG/VirB9 family P-type conjugative transfer protein n=1 Tax=Pseudomonas aeruginosa TaxID=287 RepID=UPI00053ED7A6
MNKHLHLLGASAFGALLGSVPGLAEAEVMGGGSPFDARIQTALYTPENVYRVQSVVGRASIIQLGHGETVNGETGLIVSGDPSAWNIGANQAGNLVAIKPVSDQDPNTNLIINTNRHVYVLELKLAQRVADMTYLLRFRYPEPPKKPKAARNDANPCEGAIQNRRYQKRGDLALSPSEGWDNGMLTCFRFNSAAPRPVVYRVLPDGTETVTNWHQVHDIMVVHGVSDEFRFRLNRQVLAVRTRHQGGGFYNYNGTTTGEVREVKRATEQ